METVVEIEKESHNVLTTLVEIGTNIPNIIEGNPPRDDVI